MSYSDLQTSSKADNYLILTICGSMRFFDKMLEVAGQFNATGYIVLMPFGWIKPEEQEASELKKMLDRMHFAKIDVSDAVYVVNPGGYIGKSTRNEIAHARENGVTVLSLEPLHE